jgi:hypothetical protein
LRSPDKYTGRVARHGHETSVGNLTQIIPITKHPRDVALAGIDDRSAPRWITREATTQQAGALDTKSVPAKSVPAKSVHAKSVHAKNVHAAKPRKWSVFTHVTSLAVTRHMVC